MSLPILRLPAAAAFLLLAGARRLAIGAPEALPEEAVAALLAKRIFDDPDVHGVVDQTVRAQAAKSAAKAFCAERLSLDFGGFEWQLVRVLGAGFNGITLLAEKKGVGEDARSDRRLVNVSQLAVKYSPNKQGLRHEVAHYLAFSAAHEQRGGGDATLPVVKIFNRDAKSASVIVMAVAPGVEVAELLDGWVEGAACGERSIPRSAYPLVREMLTSGLRGVSEVLGAGFANWDQSIFNSYFDRSQNKTTFIDWGFCIQEGEAMGEQPALAMVATLLDGIMRRLNTPQLGMFLVRQSAWASVALAHSNALYSSLNDPVAADYQASARLAASIADELTALGDTDAALDPLEAKRVAKRVRIYTNQQACRAHRDLLRRRAIDARAG